MKRYLHSMRNALQGKIVLDIPAGNGTTTCILRELGCAVEPFDLFPEYFLLKDITCKRADILEGIPLEDGHADVIVCQEGIEHLSDHARAFNEFNRLLKKGGKLIITTPSYSNLKAKLSYLLFECEYIGKIMPPNEIDSVWMADTSVSSKLYHGHVFLTGIQRLRLLARLAGFTMQKINFMRINKTSLLLFPFLYPFIAAASFATYYKAVSRGTEASASDRRAVYKSQLKINLNPHVLLDEHLFVVFEKTNEPGQSAFAGPADGFKSFGAIM
jgi:SAM-dependent methyltransferase